MRMKQSGEQYDSPSRPQDLTEPRTMTIQRKVVSAMIVGPPFTHQSIRKRGCSWWMRASQPMQPTVANRWSRCRRTPACTLGRERPPRPRPCCCSAAAKPVTAVSFNPKPIPFIYLVTGARHVRTPQRARSERRTRSVENSKSNRSATWSGRGRHCGICYTAHPSRSEYGLSRQLIRQRSRSLPRACVPDFPVPGGRQQRSIVWR